jgi:hypothetical protein
MVDRDPDWISPDAAQVLVWQEERVAAYKVRLRQEAQQNFTPSPSPAPSQEAIARALRHRAYLQKHGILMPTDQPNDGMVDADGSGSGSFTRAQLVRSLYAKDLLEERAESLRRQHEGLAGPDEIRWIANEEIAKDEDDEGVVVDNIGSWMKKTFGPSCQDAGEVGLACPGNPPHTKTCFSRKNPTRRHR